MTKSITVGQLRQNPTDALNEVSAGEDYDVTKHGQVVARLVAPAGHVGAQRRRGATLAEAMASPLYRDRDPAVSATMLDEVEAGRDAMGTIGR